VRSPWWPGEENALLGFITNSVLFSGESSGAGGPGSLGSLPTSVIASRWGQPRNTEGGRPSPRNNEGGSAAADPNAASAAAPPWRPGPGAGSGPGPGGPGPGPGAGPGSGVGGPGSGPGLGGSSGWDVQLEELCLQLAASLAEERLSSILTKGVDPDDEALGEGAP